MNEFVNATEVFQQMSPEQLLQLMDKMIQLSWIIVLIVGIWCISFVIKSYINLKISKNIQVKIEQEIEKNIKNKVPISSWIQSFKEWKKKRKDIKQQY